MNTFVHEQNRWNETTCMPDVEEKPVCA